MIDAKTILANAVLVQEEKVVEGAPVKGNYAIFPKESGGPLATIFPFEIRRVLGAAHPGCIFTYCAKTREANAAAIAAQTAANAKPADGKKAAPEKTKAGKDA